MRSFLHDDFRSLDRPLYIDFQLDAAKLRRIAVALQAQLDGETRVLKFAVEHENYKTVEYDSVEGVLGSDNSISNKITGLEIMGRDASRDRTIHVHFQAQARRFHASSVVELAAYSKDTVWLSNALGDIEEQLQRTKAPPKSLIERAARVAFSYTSLAFIGLAFFALGLTAAIGHLTRSRQSNRITEILASSEGARTTEAKVDFIFETAKLLLEREAQLNQHLGGTSGFSATFALGALPILLAVALAGYAVFFLYPDVRFDWGDVGEQHKRIIAKRAMVWNIVVVGLVLGVIVSLSSSAIGKWIGL